jgi:hypothetical protein
MTLIQWKTGLRSGLPEVQHLPVLDETESGPGDDNRYRRLIAAADDRGLAGAAAS